MHKINYKQISTYALIDTQLKLKILYAHGNNLTYEMDNSKSISLNIVYYMFLKRVISSKSNIRIVKNYFQLFSHYVELENDNQLKQNNSTLDKNYTITIALRNLYSV